MRDLVSIVRESFAGCRPERVQAEINWRLQAEREAAASGWNRENENQEDNNNAN